MILTGGKEARTCKMITGRRLQKVLKGKWSQLANLFSIITSKEFLGGHGKAYFTINSTRELPDQVNHLNCINELLADYEDLCMEPNSLPPTRPCDHTIHLKPNTEPINARSYRYPPLQKTEIEKMVREMLQQSIIRPSQSPFASPVLLVKKKDRSWRFCVDYRQLNAITIKDKFPIPLVEDLLDELHQAQIFQSLICVRGIIKLG